MNDSGRRLGAVKLRDDPDAPSGERLPALPLQLHRRPAEALRTWLTLQDEAATD
jgi:hypothetical protein